jgi:hypothetical protein
VVASLNVDGIFWPKLGELLVLLRTVQWDVVFLLDTRHQAKDVPYIRSPCRTALGHHSRTVFSPTLAPTAAGPRRSSPLAPGGQIAIVNHLWGRRLSISSHDPSGLGIVSSLALSTLSGSILLIGTYWPATGPVSTSHGDSNALASRLERYLTSRRDPALPQEYFESTIKRAVTAHQRHRNNTALILGDFNRRWDHPHSHNGGKQITLTARYTTALRTPGSIRSGNADGLPQ